MKSLLLFKSNLKSCILPATAAFILISSITFFSCSNQPGTTAAKSTTDTSACGCKLDIEQMIVQCPVKAINDSVIICKVGTIDALGSGRGPMKWPEYMASGYMGAEGALTDCKTGKKLFSNLLVNPIVTYRDKQVWVDKRMAFDIFDPVANTWLEGIELPTWRNIVYAEKNEIKITSDTLIFKPPFQNAKAFKSADSTYKEQIKRTDLYMRTANRLLACAVCGDTVSERRLLELEKQYPVFFKDKPSSKAFVDEKVNLLLAYKTFLNNGGKQKYFDLSVFPYFHKQMKPGTKARRSLKPLDE